MAKAKRSSSILEIASHRLAGLHSITPVHDVDSSLTLAWL